MIIMGAQHQGPTPWTFCKVSRARGSRHATKTRGRACGWWEAAHMRYGPGSSHAYLMFQLKEVSLVVDAPCRLFSSGTVSMACARLVRSTLAQGVVAGTRTRAMGSCGGGRAGLACGDCRGRLALLKGALGSCGDALGYRRDERRSRRMRCLASKTVTIVVVIAWCGRRSSGKAAIACGRT